jgi:hypothetical protein
MEFIDQLRAAIYQPFELLVTKVVGFIPTLLSVLIILILGWVVAMTVEKLVVRFLKLARLDTISEKSGIANVLLKGDIHKTLSELIGVIMYWLFMLVVILAAVNILNLNVAAELLNSVILYIPNVIAAIFILVLGIFFASVLATSVRTAASNYGISQAKGLAKTSQVIVIIFSTLEALKQLHLDVSIFTMVIQAIVFAIALGFAIAVGLGCKDLVGRSVQQFVDGFKK